MQTHMLVRVVERAKDRTLANSSFFLRFKCPEPRLRGLLDAKSRLPGAVDRVVDRWWIEGGSWLPGVDRGDLNATGVGSFGGSK